MAKFEDYTVNAVAKRVLKALKVDMKKCPREVWIDPFVNCRERGYHVRDQSRYAAAFKDRKDTERHASFAENRNSDDIVVYLGEKGDVFGFDTNVPSEEAYEGALYFYPTHHALAARVVACWLMHILKDRKDVAAFMGRYHKARSESTRAGWDTPEYHKILKGAEADGLKALSH